MKKFRQTFLEMENGLLDLKQETWIQALFFTNCIIIWTIYLVVCFSSMLFMIFDLAVISYIIIAIAMFILVVLTFNNKLFWKVAPLSAELLVRYYGRYGRVVTKEDWMKIKKKCLRIYRDIWWSKKYYGHCYFYSWCVAMLLKDAELMYCSIDKGNGNRTGHSVIVKNNCVFCTNSRQHFDLEEYKKMRRVIIYKMFSREEYISKTFFDDNREDFKKWCAQHNTYCNPE